MVSLPNIYLSNCYFLFWILCTSRTIKKADHCGTKGHFMEAHFPTLVHICVVFFRAHCFPIMTWPSAAVIRNLSHLFLSFSTLTYLPLLHLMPKKNYGPRSLGQGLLIFFCLFVYLNCPGLFWCTDRLRTIGPQQAVPQTFQTGADEGTEVHRKTEVQRKVIAYSLSPINKHV